MRENSKNHGMGPGGRLVWQRSASLQFMLAITLGMMSSDSARAASLNVEVLGHFDLYESYADVWGYASQGVELAFIAIEEISSANPTAATAIVDVTDPTNPVEVARLDVPSLDIKTYQNYAYIASDHEGGVLTIVDLSDPLSPVVVGSSIPFLAHNMFIDEAEGLLYRVNRNVAPGFQIYDLADPEHPMVVSTPLGHNPHDVYVRDGVAYVFSTLRETLRILDVEPLTTNPLTRSVTGYEGARTHSGWLTGDGDYVLVADEVYGGHLRVFDARDLSAPVEIAEWRTPEHPDSTIHDPRVRDDAVFISWYSQGLQILDVSVPEFPSRIGFFNDYDGGVANAFGVYPFAPSGNVYLSDIDSGLWIMAFTPRHGNVNGTVVDSFDGNPVPDAQVVASGAAEIAATLDTGEFHFALQPGSHVIDVTAFGFEPGSVPVSVTTGGTLTPIIPLTPLPSGVMEGQLTRVGSGDPIEGAAVRVCAIGNPDVAVLETTTGPDGRFVFARVPAGDWIVEIASFGSGVRSFQTTVQVGETTYLLPSLWPADVAFDFEAAAAAWTIEGNATQGAWTRGDPRGTGGGRTKPEFDQTTAGVNAFVTGLGTSGNDQHNQTLNDLDGGRTILRSPIWDLTDLTDPRISYYRWYSKDVYNPESGETFRVEVSSNGGGSWTPLEIVTETENQWRQRSFRLRDFVFVTSQMQVRWIASDDPSLGHPDTTIEAAVDDVEIYDGSAPSSIPEEPESSAQLLLRAPNPFQAGDPIRFQLPGSGRARLWISDVAGRRVRELYETEGIADVGERVADARAGLSDDRKNLPDNQKYTFDNRKTPSDDRENRSDVRENVVDLTWDGRSGDGRASPAGVYFLVLEQAGAAGRAVVRRIILIR